MIKLFVNKLILISFFKMLLAEFIGLILLNTFNVDEINNKDFKTNFLSS